ncbi:MAG: ACP S-malonyltransferase [Bacteroidales bacterium]|jgi:[acyl-carrier-protein] S-malonyltransferase|nr:ACP S-malonyltransferase [Bacteroidales bacterium]MBR3987416.1 ACP S-malonyltransferase [Bacteroidales bacterium]
MKSYVFPGQGAQFVGMGKDLYENNAQCRDMFERANDIIGFRITDLMFAGTPEDLKQTKVTQPAVFLHSVILAKYMGESFKPDMVGGHSLGEFSALVASGAMDFEDGLRLVIARANAMQKCCEMRPSTMAAIVKLDDKTVEDVCAEITAAGDVVVPANYNTTGQLVISGTMEGVAKASEKLKELKGRAIPLAVGGAFHSPLMEPARVELAAAIDKTQFHTPVCPCYQNVNALPQTNPEEIKQNLIKQLTSPVRWTATVQNMIKDGATEFIEVGPGTALQGMVKRISPEMDAHSAVVE